MSNVNTPAFNAIIEELVKYYTTKPSGHGPYSPSDDLTKKLMPLVATLLIERAFSEKKPKYKSSGWFIPAHEMFLDI